MNVRQKLEIIQRALGLSQTQLASKLGVSFVALNHWWNGKATPRQKKLKAIDELFLEVTGQKSIPTDQLDAKKKLIFQQTRKHKNLIDTIAANPDIRDQFFLKLTYNSNSIEGSTLTEPDTAAILFDNAIIPGKSLNEHLEAKNHQTALEYLLEHLSGNAEFDEKLVLKLHGILMNSIRSDAGIYRQHPVRIAGTTVVTANYVKVPSLMMELISIIQQSSADVIRQAAETHAKFERIHPFSDGNGRVGRLLMNALLLRSNIAPAVIRQEQKRYYYLFLQKAQIKGDATSLENFLCDAILEGFDIIDRR